MKLKLVSLKSMVPHILPLILILAASVASFMLYFGIISELLSLSLVLALLAMLAFSDVVRHVYETTNVTYMKQLMKDVNSLGSLVSKQIRPLSSRKDMYVEGKSIIDKAEKNLIVFQRTPTLLLGEEPYDAPPEGKYKYEKEFSGSCVNKINSIVDDHKDMDFVYLFSISETSRAIENIEKNVPQAGIRDVICNNIDTYKKYERASDGRFRLEGIEGILGPLAIGDSAYEFLIAKNESSKNMLILASEADVQLIHRDLGRVIGLGYQSTEKELKQRLGLNR